MTNFVRGAKISRAVIPYDRDLQATEALLVTIELFKKESPQALDGDFLRWALRGWDAHTKASLIATTGNTGAKIGGEV